MKKILSLALVLAMVLTMSVTAFATDIKNDSENKTGSTDIIYTVSDSYVVTIPDSMTVGEDATVSVSNVTLAKDHNLAVSVSSTQYNDGWKLKNGDDTIGYTLKIDNAYVANSGIVLTANSGETASRTLKTALTGTAKYSGTYTDTLTFTVAVKEHYSYDATSASASAEELKTSLTAALQASRTYLDITLASDADSTMFEAIREALKESNATAVSLTIRGAKTIPDEFLGYRPARSDNPLSEDAVNVVTSIDLPDAITIGNSAFLRCGNLTSVNAPKVQTIGECAFCESGLTSVALPEATTINDLALFGTKATEYHLPKVTILGNQTLDLGNISNEVTIYLTSANEIEVDEDCFYQMVNWYNNLATKVNLVLNDSKQSDVSNGNTWKGFTFKSITFVDTTT